MNIFKVKRIFLGGFFSGAMNRALVAVWILAQSAGMGKGSKPPDRIGESGTSVVSLH